MLLDGTGSSCIRAQAAPHGMGNRLLQRERPRGDHGVAGRNPGQVRSPHRTHDRLWADKPMLTHDENGQEDVETAGRQGRVRETGGGVCLAGRVVARTTTCWVDAGGSCRADGDQGSGRGSTGGKRRGETAFSIHRDFAQVRGSRRLSLGNQTEATLQRCRISPDLRMERSRGSHRPSASRTSPRGLGERLTLHAELEKDLDLLLRQGSTKYRHFVDDATEIELFVPPRCQRAESRRILGCCLGISAGPSPGTRAASWPFT